MTGVIKVSADVVAGAGVAVSLLLGLFYVRPLSVSKKAIDDLAAGANPVDVTTKEGGFAVTELGVLVVLAFIAGLLVAKVFLC